jgi:pyruvate kinase
MRRSRRTKIVATLGPASSTPEMIQKLFQTGADVFRLNFSHGEHKDHAERMQMIREVEARFRRPIGVLADVQGPKLRVGRFSGGGVFLKPGQTFRLDLNPTPGDGRRATLPHPEIIVAAQEGTTLLLDDGKLRLQVTRKGPDYLETLVAVGGRLSDRKGVNVPDVVLPIPALTAKDREDLAFALSIGCDYIGLSFVQRPEDVQEARDLVKGRAWIISKLEKPQALDQLDEIIALSDAVMVARGDLGVELPPEAVPIVQKRIVRRARQLGKPVIVATQMLESMISAPTPTRAEASDVATAVFDGADAVMLWPRPPRANTRSRPWRSWTASSTGWSRTLTGATAWTGPGPRRNTSPPTPSAQPPPRWRAMSRRRPSAPSPSRPPRRSASRASGRWRRSSA